MINIMTNKMLSRDKRIHAKFSIALFLNKNELQFGSIYFTNAPTPILNVIKSSICILLSAFLFNRLMN